MAEGELAGRVALVTGGSRGIGRAVCLALAREGADVAVNYTADANAAAGSRDDAEAAGARATIVKADVSSEDQVAAMVAATEAELGPVDILVTSAGIGPVEPHADLSFTSWRRVMAVNLDGTFLSIMAVRNGMVARGYGRIVCMASIAGLRARPRFIHYSASKAGVIALVRSFAEALAPGVRVNCVAPGLIATDMAENLGAEVQKAMIEEAPLGRLGTPRGHRRAYVVLALGAVEFHHRPDGGRERWPRHAALAGARGVVRACRFVVCKRIVSAERLDMSQASYLFTSESVAEGHPDKICDRISDAIVDAYLTADPLSRVAVETLCTKKLVVLAGEVRGPESMTHARLEEIARECVREIGYAQEDFHWRDMAVEVHVHEQSPDIALGVDARGNKDEGAGDQGIMFGYACGETEMLMPAPISFSHEILRSLAEARHSGAEPGLGPDAKSQVTLRYEDGAPVGATSVVVSDPARGRA